MILFDQRKGEIHGRGHSGGAEHRPVPHEDTIGFHADIGIVGGKAVGILPMGRDPAVGQQPGLGQDEGSRTGRAVAPGLRGLFPKPAISSRWTLAGAKIVMSTACSSLSYASGLPFPATPDRRLSDCLAAAAGAPRRSSACSTMCGWLIRSWRRGRAIAAMTPLHDFVEGWAGGPSPGWSRGSGPWVALPSLLEDGTQEPLRRLI